MKKLAIIFFLAANCIWAQSPFGIDIINGNLPAIQQVLLSKDFDKKFTRGIFTLNKDELRLLRNTIFAKYGYIFSSSDLQKHFSKFSWYKGTNKSVEANFSHDENDALDAIKAIENNYPDLDNNPIMRDLTGTWVYYNGSSARSITWEDIDNEAAIRRSTLYSFFPNGCIRMSNKYIGYDDIVLYGTWSADKIKIINKSRLMAYSVLPYIYGRDDSFSKYILAMDDFAVEDIKSPNGKTYKGIIEIYGNGARRLIFIKVSDDYRFY